MSNNRLKNLAVRDQAKKPPARTRGGGFANLLSQRARTASAIAVLVTFVTAVYWSALRGNFVLDDDLLVTKNPLVTTTESLQGLHAIWFSTLPVDYWPVTNTAFWLEWRLFGQNPIGYHVVSLTLHCLESLLLWLILKRLKIPGAYLAAALFAVHPVNVESVAWIASQKNLWAMLFMQLAVLCYLRIELSEGVESSSKQFAIWYGLTLVCFLAASFGKGSAVVLPGVLALTTYWIRPLRRSDAYKLGPLFAMAVILACVNVWFQTHGREVVFRNASYLERALTAGAAIWFYLYKAFLPIDLSLIYPKWNVNVGNWLWYAPMVAALAVSTALTYFELKKKGWARPFFFAWFFFLIALAPALGAADVGFFRFAVVADRYQHFALIAVVASLAAATCFVIRNETARGVFGTAAVCVLAVLAWSQTSAYRDDRTFYETTLAKYPDCWMAHTNLGSILFKNGEGDPIAAISHYERALQGNAKDADTLYNYGTALMKLNRREEATLQFRRALAAKADHLEALSSLGLALANEKRFGEALTFLQKASELGPGRADLRNNIGGALIQLHREEEAIPYLETAVKIDPKHLFAYRNLALALAKQGRFAEAAEAAESGLRQAQEVGDAAAARSFEERANRYRSQAASAVQKPSK